MFATLALQSRLTPRKTLVRIPARVRSSGLPLGAKADLKTAFLAYVKPQQCELYLIRGYLTQIRLLFLNTAGNLRRRKSELFQTTLGPNPVPYVVRTPGGQDG